MNEILRLFPVYMKQEVEKTIDEKWSDLEEIRLRVNKQIELNFSNRIELVTDIIFTRQDSMYVLNQLSDFSLYRMEDELREGYITIEGGHRVGIAGEVNTENGKIKQIQHITFFNIRIAKEILNVAAPYLHYLYQDNLYFNTIVVGPPQTGKTTFIRDLARLISDGNEQISSKKVAIVDERSEIAASIKGFPQHNVGLRTDVMDACPKINGMMMMIRSMSPEILIVDEIGKKADVDAVMEAIYAGVTVICTVHGQSIAELKSRASSKLLFSTSIFKRVIVLEKSIHSKFKIQVLNETGEVIGNCLVNKQ